MKSLIFDGNKFKLERLSIIDKMTDESVKLYDPKDVESDIHRYWDKRGIRDIILKEKRVGGEKHYIVHTPHMLHDTYSLMELYPKLLYDIWYRFKHMCGFNIKYTYGYDSFSLSVEQKAFSNMGVDKFDDIYEDDMAKFIRTCQKIALKDKEIIEKEYKEMGFLYDPKKFYSTYPTTFIDSVWWTFKQLHEKDLLEKKRTLLPWCPKCQSSLSQMDRLLSLKLKKEYIIGLPAEKGTGRNFLIHLSDLWKLLDTVGLAVHPDRDYCVVEYKGKKGPSRSLLLKENVKVIMDKIGIDDYTVVNTIPGKKLDGIEYINPFDYLLDSIGMTGERGMHRVIASENTPRSATGLYPLVPDTDAKSTDIVNEKGLPHVRLIKESGELLDDDSLGRFAGINVEDASFKVLRILKLNYHILGEIEKRSRSEFCIHCGSDFEHQENEEWFIKASSMRKRLKNLFAKVKPVPKGMGTSRTTNWVSGTEDWFISRRDGWGMPIPIWKCECGEIFIPETIDELAKAANRAGAESRTMNMLKDIRIMRVNCSKCDDEMSWEGKMFNSLTLAALSPWAQLGYPNKYQEVWWPGDIMFGSFTDEDGLFNAHLSIASDLFEEPPVKKLAGYGHIDLAQGDMVSLLKSSGEDPFRVSMVADRPMWKDHEISTEDLREPRKGLKVLWNIFQIYLTESKRCDFNPDEAHLEFLREYMCVEDKWLLSRLERLNMDVKESYQKLRFDSVVDQIEKFIVDDIAQWYIGLARKRLEEGSQRDTLCVLKILHQSLVMTSKMLAPIAPYISEKMYLKLEGEKSSVFMCEWPVTNRIFIDEILEKDMKEVQEITEGILEEKRKIGMTEKWPLKRIVVDANDLNIITLMEQYGDIIKDKAFVETIELVRPGEEWEEMILTVHPNYNAIGKSYRQWVSRIALMLEKRPAKDIKVGIEKGEYKLGIEGGIVDIQPNMVTFEKELPEGFSALETEHGGIYLDSHIITEIWEKEVLNEIILRLKSMRNDLDLDKEDEMEIFVNSSDRIMKIVEINLEKIKDALNARSIHFGEEDMDAVEYLVEWDLTGHIMELPEEPEDHETEEDEMIVDLGLIPLYRAKMISIYEAIQGMSKELAERLYEAGYTSLQRLEAATAEEISSLDDFKRSLARRIVQTVKLGGGETYLEAEDRGEAGRVIDEERNKQRLVKTLQQVDGIGPARAKAIYGSGYRSYTDFFEADIHDLTEISHVNESHAVDILDAIREEYGDIEEKPEEEQFIEEEIEVEITEEDLVEKEPDVFGDETEIITETTEEETLPSGISRSTTYLIEDEGDKAIELYQEILEAGLKGLLVTRQFPKKVKKKYGFKNVTMIWLSNVDRANAVRPKNLEKFSLNIERFLSEEQGVILLNGIEYLITNNDFRTVLHLIQSLKDQVAIKESILLIPISEKTLDRHEIDMLENEVDEVIKG